MMPAAPDARFAVSTFPRPLGAARPASASTPAHVWPRIAAAVFAFACFLPYPAVRIGNNTGLQVSQIMALGVMPLLCLCAPGRSFRAYVLLLVPVVVSAFVNLLGGVSLSPSLLKEGLSFAFAMSVLWPSEWVARPALFRHVLAAACAAFLVHEVIGLIQMYAFTHDTFPLLFLYRNPSFKAMESWAEIYALYIKRPCGLFPEPSAMTASLGPWIVLLAGLMLDPRLARVIGWRGGRLGVSALGLAFVLVALSRSGATFVIMAAVAAFCAVQAPNWARSITFGKVAALALVLCAALGAAGYGLFRLSDSFEERVDSSWGFRALSIKAGLTANTEPATLLFGVGPGQSTPVVRRALAWVALPSDQDDLAVFSLTVCYYMETGFLGALALASVLGMVLCAIARSAARVLGICTLVPWLFGVGLTTSYFALSPIWLFLAVLLAWDRLFPATPEAATR